MISILLCTYNGNKYLKELLDSLKQQTYKDINIYIHDDGSCDNTQEIINSYCLSDNRFKFVEDNIKHRGAKQSFMWLLRQVEDTYYMFCDQDDIWLPNKVELMLREIIAVESKQKQKFPVLVHSDMKVVDENLTVISDSLYSTMKIFPKYVDTFNFMGVCSCGPGCSMIFNQFAKEQSLYLSDFSIIPMHDWWVAINTVKTGVVSFFDVPTMLYRQHNNNTVGAQKVSVSYILNKLRNISATIADYPNQLRWLKEVSYGGTIKFLYYKVLYNIIRMFC